MRGRVDVRILLLALTLVLGGCSSMGITGSRGGFVSSDTAWIAEKSMLLHNKVFDPECQPNDEVEVDVEYKAINTKTGATNTRYDKKVKCSSDP